MSLVNKGIRHDALGIQSNVFGIPNVITLSLIAKAINYEDNGVYVEQYIRSNPFLTIIPKWILTNLYKSANASFLSPMEKIWHQQLVSNLLLREKDMDLLTYDDSHLLFLILMRVRVSVPLSIFNLIKSKIIAFREEMYFFDPYGQVLSELFSQEGSVKNVQKASLTEALVIH
ncbi:hypothetical protein KIW84_015688 [Lathyrus oleraceus]|uniref:Uncharacterized protein n=1 Tax=Pisum sativum TaxID=3888 RepID=A0A9D5BRH3_PEA|nr:hypothetical protein KIW84_015688 [Pisum sativum]